MKKEGIASIWIGKGKSRETFNQLLAYRITEDGMGEFEACRFCQALGIDDYDPDYFGGKFFPKDLTRLDLLFHGEPILSELKARWPTILPANCHVGLYNYEYAGRKKEFTIEGFKFIFLGCFDYLNATS